MSCRASHDEREGLSNLQNRRGSPIPAEQFHRQRVPDPSDVEDIVAFSDSSLLTDDNYSEIPSGEP
jgi:hypothetical protein